MTSSARPAVRDVASFDRSRRPVRSALLLALALVAAVSIPHTARADGVTSAGGGTVDAAPGPDAAPPDAIPADAAEGGDEPDTPALAEPPDGTAAEAGAAAPVLEGPLRPKGEATIGAAAREEAWTRSFDRGLRWSKGDTSLAITGDPRAGFRIGGSITTR